MVALDGVPCSLEDTPQLRILVIPGGQLAAVTHELPGSPVQYRVTNHAGVVVMQAYRLDDLKIGYELYLSLEAITVKIAELNREGYPTAQLERSITGAREALGMSRGREYLTEIRRTLDRVEGKMGQLKDSSAVELWLEAVFGGKIARQIREIHTANLVVLDELDYWCIRIGDPDLLPRIRLSDLRERYRAEFEDGNRGSLPSLNGSDFVADLATILELAKDDPNLAPGDIECVSKRDETFRVPLYYRYMDDAPQAVATFNSKQIAAAKTIARPSVGNLWIVVMYDGEIVAEGELLHLVDVVASRRIRVIRQRRRGRPDTSVAEVIAGHIFVDQGLPPWAGNGRIRNLRVTPGPNGVRLY